MSSIGFETVLTPTRHARRILRVSSCIALPAGALLVLWLPLRPVALLVLACLWLLVSTLEMRAQLRGMARIDRIRVSPDGALQGLAAAGDTYSLSLLPGSVVLSRVAWLRLGLADGLRYGELLTGDPRRDEHWRRLQVLWRQQPPAFGGSEGS